jgi:hypothetical protein
VRSDGLPQSNKSLNTDPQQQKAASPQMLPAGYLQR